VLLVKGRISCSSLEGALSHEWLWTPRPGLADYPDHGNMNLLLPVPKSNSASGVISINTWAWASYSVVIMNLRRSWMSTSEGHCRGKETREEWSSLLLALSLAPTQKIKAPQNLTSHGTWQMWFTSHQVITRTSSSKICARSHHPTLPLRSRKWVVWGTTGSLGICLITRQTGRRPL
jgi:hypothetical protein